MKQVYLKAARFPVQHNGAMVLLAYQDLRRRLSLSLFPRGCKMTIRIPKEEENMSSSDSSMRTDFGRTL
jgi:hypothetical protein